MPQVTDFTGLLSGSSMNGRIGVGAFFTYSFPTAPPAYLASAYTATQLASFQRFSDTYQVVARRAIDAFASVSGLTAFEAPPGQGDVQFMIFDLGLINNASGFAYYPTSGDSEIASDVFIDQDATSNGTNDYLLLHELAHAFGLKHSFEGSITLAPSVDDAAHSVVSSRFINGFKGNLGSFDVEAIQYLYGTADKDGLQAASWSWDAAAATLSQSGGSGADQMFGVGTRDVIAGGAGDDVLWGRGGGDRLEGGDGADRLMGGDGDDALLGAAGVDTLLGGSGADILTGGLGNDVMDGGGGRDTAVFAGLYQQARVTSRGTARMVTTAQDGVDQVHAVELFRFADGTLVFDAVVYDGIANADAPGAQVQRLYAAVLDRPADQIGLEHWLDQIGDRGQSIQSVAAYFLQSPEFQASGADVAANGAFVDFLYTQVLGRAADAAGRADWVARLDAGLARSDALLFFSESQEHRAQTATATAGGYFETDDVYQTIALLYDTFAQRKPDLAGLIGWSEALKSGGATIEAIADGFAASPEFQNGIEGKSRGQIVDYLYENTLDRPADTAGHAYWMGQLDGGVSIGRMLLYFAISDEHQALLAPWVTGGIDVAG